MPTYEYRCVDCGDQVEVVQSFSEPPLEVCAVCGGRLRKVYHPVGIQFKGGGFYRSEARSAPSGTRDGKAEAKPDSKAGEGTAKEKAGTTTAKEPAKKAAEKSA
jgi:putative FmdB family regulatory protein